MTMQMVDRQFYFYQKSDPETIDIVNVIVCFEFELNTLQYSH